MENNSPLSTLNSQPPLHIYDVIVIGGGLLGCFAARNLSRYKLKTALLEKREDICTGTSRANTAIIYSGCDTKPGTLKTSMCVSASQGFAALCEELGVRYSQCGSIMVSFGERGTAGLHKKLESGRQNGVRGMRLLSRDEVLEMEPNISPNVQSGLFVPDTGTVMPWELCLAAAENAAGNGVDFFLNTEVTGITRSCPGSREEGRRGGYHPPENETRSGDENSGFSIQRARVVGAAIGRPPEYADSSGYVIQTTNGVFFTRGIVNCAGMSADRVLELYSGPTVRIVPTAGDYYILDTKAAGHIKHVIFHEPEEKDKGLTLVPTVDGNILVGPTERPGDDYSTDGGGLDELRELVSLVIPTLPMEHIIRSFGAVRPNPYMLRIDENGGYYTDDRSVNDFCIIESGGGACLGFVGIKTPGLTCANELGLYAADKIAAALGAAQGSGVRDQGSGVRDQGSGVRDSNRRDGHPRPSADERGRSSLQGFPINLGSVRNEGLRSEAAKPRVLLVERAAVLGGILNQCAHTGFGLTYFGEELTGQEYAKRFVGLIEDSGVEVLTDTMVLEINSDRVITVSSAKAGLRRIHADAVILATGCRERPIGALPVTGSRPAGIFTAGSAQKMLNLGGYDIGSRIVILGSGDVGLIVARELALRGKEVIAVIEKEPVCGGLERNRINCLEKFGIPLVTLATVRKVHGQKRVTGVTVSDMSGGERFVGCDTLITSVGLIPERELLDGFLKQESGHSASTIPDWLFLCGNAAYVHDVVDDVTIESGRVGALSTNYKAQSTNHKLQITNYKSQITNYKAQSTKQMPTRTLDPGDVQGLAKHAVLCIACPKECVAVLTGNGWEGLACGRPEPETC